MLYAYGGFSLIKDLTDSVKNFATTTFSKLEDFSSPKNLKLYLIFFNFYFICNGCLACMYVYESVHLVASEATRGL